MLCPSCGRIERNWLTGRPNSATEHDVNVTVSEIRTHLGKRAVHDVSDRSRI